MKQEKEAPTPDLTEIEKRLAERAEAEFDAEATGLEPPAEPPPSLFEDRWEPPARPLYDYEVVALVNRDCGRYAQTGLMLDSVEDIEAFAEQQLDSYRERMTVYQAEYYKITVAELLFKAVLTSLLRMQRRHEADYRTAANQIAEEAGKPRKKGRRSS